MDKLGSRLRHVFIAPALPGSPDLIAETREFANTMVLEVRQELLRPEARTTKRMLDLVVVMFFFVLLGWFFLSVALMIKLTSSGSIFTGKPVSRWQRLPLRNSEVWFLMRKKY